MPEKSLRSLYEQQPNDEKVTEFSDASGFSIIRKYPEDSTYAKDGMRMFIKVGIYDGRFSFSVDMTEPKDRNGTTEYSIIDGVKYNKKITNFFSGGETDEFSFNSETDKVTHIKTGRKLSMNEFVEVLIYNHLSDRLFWKRKLNTLALLTLKVLFWLADKRYEKVQVLLDIHRFNHEGKPPLEKQNNIEPFFKYFFISKNLLFAILIITFPVSVIVNMVCTPIDPMNPINSSLLCQIGDFSISNPSILLLFFLVLFSCERFSLWLEQKIKQLMEKDQNVFKKRKENFIEWLHNYQHRNQFELKLKTKISASKS